MKAQVATYIKACTSYNRNKTLNRIPSGLLMPLQIPDAPWSSISVDFITNLPLSNGAKAIMVVVDRFAKWAEFFPCSSLLRLKVRRPISWKRSSLVTACQRRLSPTKEHNLCQYFSCCWLRRWISNNACHLLSTPNSMVKLRGLIKILSIVLNATPQTPRTIGLTYCCWLCLPTTATTTAPQRCLLCFKVWLPSQCCES